MSPRKLDALRNPPVFTRSGILKQSSNQGIFYLLIRGLGTARRLSMQHFGSLESQYSVLHDAGATRTMQLLSGSWTMGASTMRARPAMRPCPAKSGRLKGALPSCARAGARGPTSLSMRKSAGSTCYGTLRCTTNNVIFGWPSFSGRRGMVKNAVPACYSGFEWWIKVVVSSGQFEVQLVAGLSQPDINP
eukprot:scaffold9645_cov34-Tisochrysis_lutea.AAC.1